MCLWFDSRPKHEKKRNQHHFRELLRHRLPREHAGFMKFMRKLLIHCASHFVICEFGVNRCAVAA